MGSVSEYSLKGLACAAASSFAIAQRSWCEEVEKNMQENGFTKLFSLTGLPELVMILLTSPP